MGAAAGTRAPPWGEAGALERLRTRDMVKQPGCSSACLLRSRGLPASCGRHGLPAPPRSSARARLGERWRWIWRAKILRAPKSAAVRAGSERAVNPRRLAVQRCCSVYSRLGARDAVVVSQGDDASVAWLREGPFCKNVGSQTPVVRALRLLDLVINSDLVNDFEPLRSTDSNKKA